jgi:hypothetical protein
MSLLNLFNNISYPLSYNPLGVIPQSVGIYSSGLIGAFSDPYTLLSPWSSIPVSYPYGTSPTVIPDPTYSFSFNPYYSGTGTTQNTNVRYKVVLIEDEDDNNPVYYLMPDDINCPCPEHARLYGIPCSIVEGTKYFFGEETFYKFSVLPGPYGYMAGPYGYMAGPYNNMGGLYGYMAGPSGFILGAMTQTPIQ